MATFDSSHIAGKGSRFHTRLIVLLVVLIVIASALAYVLTEGSGQRSVSAKLPSSFTIHGETFAITYLATTPSEWQKGLMNTTVSDNTIMLFAFPRTDYYSFWMYDVNSSLDIIWLSSNGTTGRVVYILPGAPPCHYAPECVTYDPAVPANYVLEAKAGFAARNNVTMGSTIQFG